MNVKCPNCGKLVSWEGNPYKPFCSEKCKLADLSKWFCEEYSIAVEDRIEGEENNSSS